MIPSIMYAQSNRDEVCSPVPSIAAKADQGGRSVFAGKRDLLARCMYWSGCTLLFSRLPAQDSLLVLVYHRIGRSEDDEFDPGVFSATADQFEKQIAHLTRSGALVTLEEARAFIDRPPKDATSRCRVLITFDDGYLDNYELAFPILRSYRAQGVFFLSTGLIGSCFVPWWDRVAFFLKTARKHRFCLQYPRHLTVDFVHDGIRKSIRNVLYLYKSRENKEPERFIQELKEQTNGADPPQAMRRFLSWEEAKAMINGGMAIGSHAHSHRLLSQLEPQQQTQELTHSRTLLREKLGVEVESIAYPDGGKDTFSEQTQMLAQRAGYSIGFSYYGGTNSVGHSNSYDVKRIGVFSDLTLPRFRVQTATFRAMGRYWP